MRYWEQEEEEERKAIEECIVCGEKGHDKRSCPHELCLACGALDQHNTRDCRIGVSCFRCGDMGHRSGECSQPRQNGNAGAGRSQPRGPRQSFGRGGGCGQCGSHHHADKRCPTLFRIYYHNDEEEYQKVRLEKWQQLQSVAGPSSKRPTKRHGYHSSDDEEEGEVDGARAGGPPAHWDPVRRWCYNCAGQGHWGDDCPVPRCNPLRASGDPTIYSEAMANTGPFANRYQTATNGDASSTSNHVPWPSAAIVEDHHGADPDGSVFAEGDPFPFRRREESSHRGGGGGKGGRGKEHGNRKDRKRAREAERKNQGINGGHHSRSSIHKKRSQKDLKDRLSGDASGGHGGAGSKKKKQKQK